RNSLAVGFLVAFPQWRHGRRLRRHDAEDVHQHPFSAQDRRRPVRVRRDQKHGAFAEQAAAVVESAVERHATKSAAVLVGNADLGTVWPLAFLSLSLNGGTAGGSGGTTPRMFISTHFPRRTGDVRSGFDVIRSTAPLPSRPRRSSSPPSSVTRRNPLPYTLGMP